MPDEKTDLSWQEVLATLEAHAESAELLLASHPRRSRSRSQFDDDDDRDEQSPVIAPWEWELPSHDDLPPLPVELQVRAIAIRDRIDRLQARIARELDEAPVHAEHPRHRFPAFNRSMYIDVTV